MSPASDYRSLGQDASPESSESRHFEEIKSQLQEIESRLASHKNKDKQIEKHLRKIKEKLKDLGLQMSARDNSGLIISLQVITILLVFFW